ncbi:metallophosphoesterase [Deinococcus sp. YIM 134068]|uniref:metallophosphoesterase n=1 Tax=Deinococcus lichenicola TaxID=3118910 RepID=UPI002F959C38
MAEPGWAAADAPAMKTLLTWKADSWDGSWLVIPDIHGHAARLRAAMEVANGPHRRSRLVFLGDLIDDSTRRREARRARATAGTPDDSREVLETVRSLVESGRAEVLLGNHEVMATAGVLDDDRALMNLWWKVGGREAAASYGWSGKGDAGALAEDLRWLREHGRLWLEVGAPESRILLSHATRPSPERLAGGRNRAADLRDDAEDHVVWFPLGLHADNGTRLRDLPLLPPDFTASLHGHMETPALWTLLDREDKPALQLDLHPGKRKLCLMVVSDDGEMKPHITFIPPD